MLSLVKFIFVVITLLVLTQDVTSHWIGGWPGGWGRPYGAGGWGRPYGAGGGIVVGGGFGFARFGGYAPPPPFYYHPPPPFFG